jgi:molybdate transport system substrate-binding protein
MTAYAAGAEPSGRELTVFAASSLTDAMDEIAAEFEADNQGVRVVMNYASSPKLATQILEGAPADIFASANAKQMANVVDGGFVDGETDFFASNRLVAIVPADNPARIERLSDLGKPGVALVLALPGVPVRNYTDQFISHVEADPNYGLTFSTGFYANVVSEEDNVRRVATKVALGEADSGVVYISDVTDDITDDIQQIPIPEEYNIYATYPIAMLKKAPESELAQDFIEYVLSPDGQAILGKWGFGARPLE